MRLRGKRRIWRIAWLVMVPVMLAGCGGTGTLEPPSTPGTATQLENSVWRIGQGEMTFLPNGQAVYSDGDDGTLQGTYSVTGGVVVAVVRPLPPMRATWDGTRLVVENVGEVERIGTAP